MPYGCSVHSHSPLFSQGGRLSDVQDAGPFFVAAVHLSPGLCRSEGHYVRLTRETVTQLFVLGDMPAALCFGCVPRHHGDQLAYIRTQRSLFSPIVLRHRCSFLHRLQHCENLPCLMSPTGNLRLAPRPGMVTVYPQSAENGVVRRILVVSLSVRQVHRHASPRRGPAAWERVWQSTPHRVYAVYMVALSLIIAACENGASSCRANA